MYVKAKDTPMPERDTVTHVWGCLEKKFLKKNMLKLEIMLKYRVRVWRWLVLK